MESNVTYGKYDIVGGKVLIIGDLHFSDVYNGKHKSYLTNCFDVLGELSNIIDKEKPSAVILLGDIVGWSETNVRDREVLSMLCKIIKSWGTVYSVRGNHDLKGYPEFQFLSDLGIIITGADCGGYFDYYGFEGQEIPEIRFHIVDYKDETKALNLRKDGCSNIVLGHNNYTIEGETNWYAEHDGIELKMLQNYAGVDMLISGHIHNPSPAFIETTMIDGSTCSLLYPGCPTRPVKDKNMYESCLLVNIKYNAEFKNTDINTITLPLKPSEEVFYSDSEFVEEQDADALADAVRKEALKDVLGDLCTYRMNNGDPLVQVENIPNATPEAKAVAKDYLQQALNMGA